MKINIGDIFEIINKIPQEKRAKWGDLQFIIEDGVLCLDNGNYVAGKWFNGGIITLYSEFIPNKKELKKIILHEISHHLGLTHKEIDELKL